MLDKYSLRYISSMLGDLGESDLKTPLMIPRPSSGGSVDFDFITKVLIVGDSVVGKSQLFKRFADETFSEVHEPTQTVEYRHRFIQTNEFRCKVQVWDCVSSVSKTLMSSIYKGANAVVLLVDVTNRSSLESVPDWLKEIREYAPGATPVYLVATKIDCDDWKFTSEELSEMAEKHQLKHWELSAKTGVNVDSLFYKIVADVKDDTLMAMEEREQSMASSQRNTSERLSHYSATTNNDQQEEEGYCCLIL